MKQYKLLDVMPECYVDTNLIEYLLNAGVNHQHCCSKVVGQLNTTFADKFGIGIIDKDKVQLGYLAECDLIVQSKHLSIYRHRQRSQYLITIKPAVDGFILDCAKDLDVFPEAFGLPSELREFIKISKSVTSNADYRFKSLFASLAKHSEIQALKKLLVYLCENRYQSSLDEIKNIFDNM